jgi:PAS domain S-box-containing protein
MGIKNGLSEIINRVPNIAIFTIDKKRNITDWNLASQKLYGYEKSEVI